MGVQKLASVFPQISEEKWRQTALETGLDTSKTQAHLEEAWNNSVIGFGTMTETPAALISRIRTSSQVQLRQAVWSSDVSEINRNIRAELKNGVQEILLEADLATAQGIDSDDPSAKSQMGQFGVPISCIDDLDLMLAGVDLQNTPVALSPGRYGVVVSSLLLGLFERRNHSLNQITAHLGIAPISSNVGAQNPAAQTLDDSITLARWCAIQAPKITVFRPSDVSWHNAGAHRAQCLGLLIAEIAEIFRHAHKQGLPWTTCWKQLEVSVSLEADVYGNIAKVRALRLLLQKLKEVFDLPADTPLPTIHGYCAWRMQSQIDPWVNILRNTAAAFSAKVTQVDSLTIHPFNSAFGSASELGNRLARNTAHILQDEAHLSHVTDPAAGSPYFENRTSQLAEQSWNLFQQIESNEGLAQSIHQGWLQDVLAKTQGHRESLFNEQKLVLTGTTAFAPTFEQTKENYIQDLQTPNNVSEEVLTNAANRLSLCRLRCPPFSQQSLRSSQLVNELIRLTREGATLQMLKQQLHPQVAATTEVKPFKLSRNAEPFEALRKRSYNAANRPHVAYIIATEDSPDIKTSKARLKNILNILGIPLKAKANPEDKALAIILGQTATEVPTSHRSIRVTPSNLATLAQTILSAME